MLSICVLLARELLALVSRVGLWCDDAVHERSGFGRSLRAGGSGARGELFHSGAKYSNCCLSIRPPVFCKSTDIPINAQVAETGSSGHPTTTENHTRKEYPANWRALHHRSLIREIALNHKRVSFSQVDGKPQIPMWHKGGNSNSTSATNSLNNLLTTIQFHDHLLPEIKYSSIGFIALRHHNASSTKDATAVTLRLQNDTSRLWLLIDFDQFKTAIRPLVPEPYTITLQLDNPYLQEPFLLHLGDVELVRLQVPRLLQPFRLADLWDGSMLDKFLQRCATDPSFEPLLTTRMMWGEVLVSLFSVTYCTAVTWLGPLDFTNWQLRAYQLSCVTGIFFQFIFLGWCSNVLPTELAFPLALSIALIYFSAFNVTNVLILLERDDAFPELEFSHIQHQPASLCVLHAKRARWH